MRMVWWWREIHKVNFKPWKKATRPTPNLEDSVKEKEITDHKEISNNIKTLYETLVKRNVSKTNVEKQQFLNSLNTKTLTNEQYDLCENKICETEFFNFMESMKKNKTPGNDGLTK